MGENKVKLPGSYAWRKKPNWKKKKMVLKIKNFIFDHKGVQIPELNLKAKEKKQFYFRFSDSQVKKLVRTPSLNFNTSHSDTLDEKRELNYLGTQLGQKFSAFFHLQYSEELPTLLPPLFTHLSLFLCILFDLP